MKAADPTIVEAPSSPGVEPRVMQVSYTFNMISGALEPNAMSVKLASVGFQISDFLTTLVPSGISVITVLVCDVMTSIDSMNTSDMSAMPMKK